MTTVTLTFTERKKHSVRYDSDGEAAPLRTVYIRKEAVPNPPPDHVEIELRWPDA